MKNFKNFETALVNETYFDTPNYNDELVSPSLLKDIVESAGELSSEFISKVDFKEISDYVNELTFGVKFISI